MFDKLLKAGLDRFDRLVIAAVVLIVLFLGGWLVSSIRSDARDKAVAEIAADTTETIKEIGKSHEAIAEKSAAGGDSAVDDSLRNGSFLLKPDATGGGGAAPAH